MDQTDVLLVSGKGATDECSLWAANVDRRDDRVRFGSAREQEQRSACVRTDFNDRPKWTALSSKM
jgi:hypothetical protein